MTAVADSDFDAFAPGAEIKAAEQAVLGGMMHNQAARQTAQAILTGSEFFRPAHATIFEAIRELSDQDRDTDAIAVADHLAKTDRIKQSGGYPYLFELYQGVITTTNISYHAVMVRNEARRRGMLTEARRYLQAVSEAQTLDQALDAGARHVLATELQVDAHLADQKIERLSTWSEFIGTEDRPRDWIVPDLYEAGDVWMVLGSGGSGKSWLSRQLCMSIAAGVHPFHERRRIEPQRTLLVDLEVSDSMLRAQSRDPLNAVERLGDKCGDRGMVWRKQDGLNLRKREDAMLLERVVDEVRPKFVALGSLYKAYSKGRDDWDTASEECRAVFDRIRKRYGVCWWLEHHQPRSQHGGSSGVPYGGAAWDKWPTHGRLLSRVPDTRFPLYHFTSTWRSDRDPREVPVGLRRSGGSANAMPWLPVWEDAEMEELIKAAGGKP